MGRDDDDIDAAIEAASVFAGVFGDGVVLGITGGRKASEDNALAGEQKADDLGGAGGGELPVGLELRGVDGNIVGVSFHAEIASDRGEDRADTVKGIHGVGAQSCRAAFEKSNLAKAEDEALGGFAERDGMV